MAKGTLQLRRRWAKARARACGRGGNDGAGHEQGEGTAGAHGWPGIEQRAGACGCGCSGGARKEKMK